MLDIIHPIITQVYGDTKHAQALAVYLDARLRGDDWKIAEDRREDAIRNICWDWMTGGDTAAYVAGRIEAGLKEAGL